MADGENRVEPPLSDEHLAKMEDWFRRTYDYVAAQAIAELRARRAADLTDEERSVLAGLRGQIKNDCDWRISDGYAPGNLGLARLRVLDRILGSRR